MILRAAILLLFSIALSSCEDSQDQVASEKVLVCYWSSWSFYRPGQGKFSVQNVDPKLCTHLVYAFAKMENGVIAAHDPQLDLPDNGGRGMYKQFNALKQVNPKLKTIIAIGGWNEGSAKYSAMASTEEGRQKFAKSVVDFLDHHGFDGLDMDWIYPALNGGAPDDTDNFVLLLKTLKEAMKPKNYILTAAVSGMKLIVDHAYKVEEMAKYLDLMSIMGYDFTGSWEKTTSHHSALRAREDASEAEAAANIESSIDMWIAKGADKSKLVLGMPLYGRSFTLEDPTKPGFMAPISGPGPAGPYTGQGGLLGYTEVCKKLQTSGDWKVTRDAKVVAPVAVREKEWIGFDDAQSLTDKVRYAMSKGLAGAMVWSIDTDDFRAECGNGAYPLLNAVRSSLNLQLGEEELPKSSSPSQRANGEPTTFARRKPDWMSEIVTPSAVAARNAEPATYARKKPEQDNEKQVSDESKPLTCETQGMRVHPEDKQKFYRCVQNPNGEFTSYSFVCPATTVFDEKSSVCVHAA